VSGVDLYFELRDYYFTKGAADTGIGSIIAVSDKTPSLIGIVFAVLGLIIDAATLVKHGLKIAGIIGKLADETADSTKILGDLYDELRLNKMIAETLSKDDFIKQMDELLKRDKALLEKHREAIEGLMKQMKIAQKLDNIPSAVQYALARMYDINPTVTRAIIKAKDGHKIFLRLTVDLLSSPNAAHDYTKLANLFLKEGDELSEEGVTVLRYLTESVPGTIDECSSVVKIIEEAVIRTGKSFDPKFMQEVLTDQRLRKLITENPADLDAIAKHYDEWVKNGSKGAFADGVSKIINTVKILSKEEIEIVELTGSGRTISHYTDINGASGITNIDKKVLEQVDVGEGIVIQELKFGEGKTSFLTSQNKPGEIFVTDLAFPLSSGKLNQIGVFGEKQNWVLLFSEEDAFLQNARIIPQIADRGIYSIPSNSNLLGTYKLIRTR
jgi:hypothetical protein